MFRVHRAGYGKPIFQLGIVYAVSAHQRNAGFFHLVYPALEHVFQDGYVQLFYREADYVHGGQGLAAHGIDIAQGVGDGNLAEVVGVIDNGREEIDGLDDSQVIAQLVNAGIIQAFHASNHVLISYYRQAA